MSDPTEEVTAQAAEQCHKCHATQTNLKQCGGCQAVFYCSEDCQKNDWKVHKSECTKIGGEKLLRAITKNDLETVKKLAKSKRVVNCRVDYTPPPEPIAGGRDYDDDERTCNLGKWTPLHECVRKQRVDAMKILLEHGANVEIKDVDGETPLFVASSASNLQILKLLIDAGANPNAPGNDGWTALMMATRDMKYEQVKALLDAGADVESGADMFGRTAFHIAQQFRTQPVRFMEGESPASAKERSELTYQALLNHMSRMR